MSLSIDQFTNFFQELHDRPPYSWQTRLAAMAVDGKWPGAIDLPTGSGKTACIDVAVFALACQAARPIEGRTAPRRIFFCVNRRVIVDEAFQRARRIAEKLLSAAPEGAPILCEVADALRRIAGTVGDNSAPPLDVLELRGGIYRDNRWARSAAQPTVVCTTIDQLGSRLLFRGYGVSPNAAPIQAALIAYDSLVLLDEAHISRPFLESLQQVAGYLNPERWAETPVGPRPMIVVPMTATRPAGVNPDDVIRLDDADRRSESLDKRLRAGKRAVLASVPEVEKALVERAAEFAQEGNAAVGIIVNRVATAKAIYCSLREGHPNDVVELVIGSMRPIDRDEQSERLTTLIGRDRPPRSSATSFVVATQCLEVGADYDFDVLLTECASLDALRQRFGRLNRAGRDVDARAVIVVKDKDVKPDDAFDDAKPFDPIYGNALARTWNWLRDHAAADSRTDGEVTGKRPKGKAKGPHESRTIEFGIDAFQTILEESSPDGTVPASLFAPSASAHAPVMLPGYVDFWCQTAPNPVPDPDISLFLHGKQHGEPDVQVCWRADLNRSEIPVESWPDVVALVPPSSAECMGVPLKHFRRWFAGGDQAKADFGDVLEVAADPDQEQLQSRNQDRLALIWRGPERSMILRSVEHLHELRPGDTIVLPQGGGGWEELGHVPTPARTDGEATPPIDVAEDAFLAARDRRVLRLHPALSTRFPDTEGVRALFARIADADDPVTNKELEDLLENAATELPDTIVRRETLFAFARGPFLRESYPDGRGLVLTSRRRPRTRNSWLLPALDDGDDDASRTTREAPVSLDDHTGHVREAVGQILKLIHTNVSSDVYSRAADRHDWGKADDRFQAMLLGASRTDAWLWSGDGSPLLAKAGGFPRTAIERRAARERAGLPAGFRHEMLSVQLAEAAPWPGPAHAQRDLVLHLIAAHHGHARPFAPVVRDDDPPAVELSEITCTAADRRRQPPHRLDSGVAERFWFLTRRYGWWGLAYLEALLRLADQKASADEDHDQTPPREDGK